ncbi:MULTISPECIES: isochorismatase family protein [unclassified Pseudodesulfovibrio]|uniref:cysteine hydrolase family protein n=1 Tax=unclassified Pseudodesulfovibrio TaxID=2661612 RepID=UPI0013E34ED8|nr:MULTISPECIES: isochorismatase family protein [unclassified Pseudodesulfovibrio]MCJ2165964.1 isochorismatase family protein [Pseudodesulfovibrio sp. S3-i]
MSGATVLVVVDVQNIMFETPGYEPFEGERVLKTIAGLIAAARHGHVPVYYIQHTTEGAGSDFEKDSHNWLIRPEIAPKKGDHITFKTSYDAFWKTDFDANLKQLGARKLVFCGLQTECCVDTTVRSALAHGYKSVLVGDAHTSYDNGVLTGGQIVAHHNQTLHRRFCTVMTAENVCFD